jgi:hypothetical protein
MPAPAGEKHPPPFGTMAGGRVLAGGFEPASEPGKLGRMAKAMAFARLAPPQCAISTGIFAFSSMFRVAPPKIASRNREWP